MINSNGNQVNKTIELDNVSIVNTYMGELGENVQEAMAFVDNGDRIQCINNAFTSMFGYYEDEVVGKSIYDVIVPQNELYEVQNHSESLNLGQKLMFEGNRIHKDGTILDLLILGSPIIKDDKLIGRYIIYRDMDGNKLLEKKLEKVEGELKDATANLVHTERMTALGELTASIAHELNQPLNNMKIICQDVLRDIKKDRLDVETIPESIEDVVEQINRMAKIIDHMRVFTRRLDDTMNKREMEIPVILDNIFMLMGEQLRVHNIYVVKELSSDLPRVYGNDIAIEQVITNILVNARHAVETFRDKNREIEIKSYMNNEDEIAVSIRNNGGKISEEIVQKIFEPFFTTKEPGKGTGLGLSISKKIMEEHGGRIELEVGEDWTKFIVIMPVHSGGEE